MVGKVPFSNETNQYSELLVSMYKGNKEILVIDMIKTLHLDKMGQMLETCYDLNLPLISAVSRPPSFKTKAASLLKSRYKNFSKPPEIKRLISCIKELSKHFEQDTLPKNVLLKYSMIEKDVAVIEEEHPDQKRYVCHDISPSERYVSF
jgi:hypothetical protein